MKSLFVDLAQLAPQPWKNGAGLTREIASAAAADGSGGFDWRISVAEVDRAAPFSTFPGIARCIVLLHGGGLRLHGGGELDHRLDQPFVPFHFSGDLALTGTPLAGPSRDLNLMTRRGHWRAEVDVHRAGFALHPAEVTLLWCGAGSWSSSEAAAPVLQPDQGLLLHGAGEVLHCAPHSDAVAACLLVARLCHDPGP